MFTDTPGFHKPSTLLGTRLNNLVRDAVEGVDAVVMVVDVAAGVGRGDAYVYAQQVASASGMKVCVANKIDGLHHHNLVPQLAAAQELGEFDESCRCRRATTTASTCCATCWWRACPRARPCSVG